MADAIFTLSQTCGACPLQYEGRVGDKWWYYRGRWGKWWFGVGDSVEDAASVACGLKTGFCRWGEGGDVDPVIAEANVRWCAEEYLAAPR